MKDHPYYIKRFNVTPLHVTKSMDESSGMMDQGSSTSIANPCLWGRTDKDYPIRNLNKPKQNISVEYDFCFCAYQRRKLFSGAMKT